MKMSNYAEEREFYLQDGRDLAEIQDLDGNTKADDANLRHQISSLFRYKLSMFFI